MGRAIVIPIYDHTRDREIEEIMVELERLGFAMRPVVVSGYVFPDAVAREIVESGDELRGETKAIAGRPGWRSDREGREWYSSAWLDGVV